jgi:hypothetical protein
VNVGVAEAMAGRQIAIRVHAAHERFEVLNLAVIRDPFARAGRTAHLLRALERAKPFVDLFG